MQRRADAATPGPWRAFVEGRDHVGGDDFIAGARQDVPRLLAELRRLREALRPR